MRRLLLCLLCSLGIASLASVGYTSTTPPDSGDWTIEVGEYADLSGGVVPVPGNLFVYGTLTITNAILQFDSAAPGMWVYGHVYATDTIITSTGGNVVYLYVGGTSSNEFRGCTFDPVRAKFAEQSVNSFGQSPVTLAECRFGGHPWTYFLDDSKNFLEDTTFGTYAVFAGRSTNHATRCAFVCYWHVGGWAAEESHNTFLDCTFTGFEFHSPSVNVLDGCTFDGGWTCLYAATDTTLALSGIEPGNQTSTIIESSTNNFQVGLTNTWVDQFYLAAHSNAHLTLTNCRVGQLYCHDYSQTTLVDSQIDGFYLWTMNHKSGRGGATCPYLGDTVNVSVAGFTDDGAPVTTDVTSDNSSFGVSFTHTSVSRSWWILGDNGGPVGSSNQIVDSLIWYLVSCENASVLAQRSTMWGEVGTGRGMGAAPPGLAELVAEDCTLTQLTLDGAETRTVLRRSTFEADLVFSNYWGSPSPAPNLVLESSSLLPTKVWVKPGVSGARVSGDVAVDPICWVYEWAPESTIIRSFPVLVQRPGDQPVEGASVEVTDPSGAVIWSGTTNAEGLAYPEMTFDDTNHGTEFAVTATAAGNSADAPLTFLSSTPIELNFAYPLQWVAPLQDGTSVESPDGPFKRGRTIPVKFRLLGADGQVIPDAEAEALVATLQVFYEEPNDQGTPVDPGDAPPDIGDEFRYVAEDDLFIYNRSTKDAAWLADYTYGLEVLLDGVKAGEVYFSLR